MKEHYHKRKGEGFCIEVYIEDGMLHKNVCIRPVSLGHREYLLENGWNEGCDMHETSNNSS